MIPSIYKCSAVSFLNDRERIPTVPGVYGIEHLPSSRFYVGSSLNINKRLQWHLRRIRSGTHTNHRMNALKSESINNFMVHVFYTGEDALILEDSMIKKYRLGYTGLNCTTGINEGRLCSTESREKHRLGVSRPYHLKRYGIVYEGRNLVRFAKSMNEDHYMLNQINRGQALHAHGWTKPGNTPPGTYLRSKDGQTVFVGRHQIREFARDKSIADKSLRNVLSGRIRNAKHGWKRVAKVEKTSPVEQPPKVADFVYYVT